MTRCCSICLWWYELVRCWSIFSWYNTVLQHETFCCGRVIAVKLDAQVIDGGGHFNWNMFSTKFVQHGWSVWKQEFQHLLWATKVQHWKRLHCSLLYTNSLSINEASNKNTDIHCWLLLLPSLPSWICTKSWHSIPMAGCRSHSRNVTVILDPGWVVRIQAQCWLCWYGNG